MKKWLGIWLATLLCIATVLAGCGKQTASSGEGLKIFFSLNSMDTFRSILVDAAQNAAKERNVQLDVVDAEGVIENQVSQIKQAVADHYDLIICSAVSVETAVELKASAGDLPVVFVNSCPADEQLKAGRYIYVGSDEKVAGQYQAEYILDQLAGQDEINVMLLKGPTAHSATVGRTKGLKQTLAASGKTIRYVFEDCANWEADKAEQMFEVFMRTGSDVDCIVCNNDSMAIGAAQACKKAGVDFDQNLILGVDATADGCKAIQDGEVDFTVYQSAIGQGEAAIEAAIKLASGASTDDIEGVTDDGKYVWVPFEKVDSSNVSQYVK